MKKISVNNIPQLSIKELTVLPMEDLLELAEEAEEALLAAKRLKDWIDGAIALKNSTNISGGLK